MLAALWGLLTEEVHLARSLCAELAVTAGSELVLLIGPAGSKLVLLIGPAGSELVLLVVTAGSKLVLLVVPAWAMAWDASTAAFSAW